MTQAKPDDGPVSIADRRQSAQLSLGGLLRRQASRIPTSPMVTFGDRTLTFGEFNERVNRLAAALRRRGVVSGGMVGVWMLNRLEMLEAYFAIHKLGAVAVPINFRLSGDEVQYVVDDASVVGILADRDLHGSVSPSPNVSWTLLTGGDATDDDSYESALQCEEPSEPLTVVNDDDPAFVMYTSGTTGRPKGALLSHKNILASAFNFIFETGVRRGDAATSGFPLFHVGGLGGFYPFAFVGSHVVVQRSGAFDPEEAIGIIERFDITCAAFVPAQWQLIVERPEAVSRLAGLRRALWGGAPASRPILESMTSVLPVDSVVCNFGQTEVAATATYLPPEDALRKLESVGLPAVGVEIRIVDEEGRDVTPGDVGEIVYRGPTVMLGYLNMPEATEESFFGDWFRSGDLVRADDEGYLYVVDRIKDVIISGGENIYPAEVERVIAAVEGVREVAVVGVPDERWTETPVAHVVLEPNAAITTDELLAECTEQLARYKRPSKIVFLPVLPRNAAGKVLKRTLRDLEQPHE